MSKGKQAVASKRALSKRKAASAPKRARRPKVAARAQRSKQTFVRSPRRLRPDTSGWTEPPIEVHDEARQETSIDNRARAVALEAILQAASQDDASQKMRENTSKNGLDLTLLIASVQAYQAKLLEVTQANMQFVFDLTQSVAVCKSPFEFFAVVAEFTGRRIIMIGKHSKELTAFWRLDS